MQNIPCRLLIGPDSQSWIDRYGVTTTSPSIFIGALVRLDIELLAIGSDGELRPYGISHFSDVASWYVAVDGDYRRETDPVILQTSGIELIDTNDGTILAVSVPDTDSPAMRTALAANSHVVLTMEIGGLDAEGHVVACLQIPLLIKNRVWISGDAPAAVTSNPEYLNTAQVTALVASSVQAAVTQALEGINGQDGISPTITLGTVADGDEASAELVPGENNAYTLNLVLPRGAAGAPGAPGTIGAMPTLAVGSVIDGTDAEARIEPDGQSGYTLSLTLPKGKGITYAGIWNAATAYPLNAVVRHGNATWLSLADDNLDNRPGMDAQQWAELNRDGLPIEFRYAPSEEGPWHSSPVSINDTHYCISEDGGATWSIPLPLAPASPAALRVIYAYNPDAESDWQEITPAQSGTPYATGTGRYVRVTSNLGIVSNAYDLTNDALGPLPFRFQFADNSNPASPDWHADLRETDTQVRCYTADSSVQLILNFNLSAGTTPQKIEICSIRDPWHSEFAANDRYYRISGDGGETWTPSFAMPLLDEAPSDGKFYTRQNGQWVEIPAASGASGSSGTSGNSGSSGTSGESDSQEGDLPEHSERRIWEYLPFPRPDDERELHICWQTSMDGTTWTRELNSLDHPSQAFMSSGSQIVPFVAESAADAYLKTEHIAPCHVHVRLCWAFVDGNGKWHKGDWIYRNTIGVLCSRDGEPMQRPLFRNPEYFIIPIPEDADQCSIQLSDTGESWHGEQYFFTDRHFTPDQNAAMFFFDGRDLIANTAEAENAFPTSFASPAFAGQWLVFRRRGIPKYHIRAVWTGATPAVYTWSPED